MVVKVVAQKELGTKEEMSLVVYANAPIVNMAALSSLEEDYHGGVWSTELQQAFDEINFPLPTQKENKAAAWTTQSRGSRGICCRESSKLSSSICCPSTHESNSRAFSIRIWFLSQNFAPNFAFGAPGKKTYNSK